MSRLVWPLCDWSHVLNATRTATYIMGLDRVTDHFAIELGMKSVPGRVWATFFTVVQKVEEVSPNGFVGEKG
jgi:hypothetical protein